MSGYRLIRTDRPPPDAPVLDGAQRRVVDHRGGPLLVLAGPGTGKTTTLVEAAVERVRSGVPVEQILMLTFSRRAAGELRDRVTARLGGTVREPIARTLHSYAFGVLRLANLAVGLPAPRLLSGPEQDIVLRELVAGRDPMSWPVELRAALRTRAFATELRDLLMRAVERGLDGPDLERLGQERGRDDWVAAGRFLTEYHQVNALARPGAYDPAELIRSALSALRDDRELLAAERARRRHIFIDEYQDTDPAQADLLHLIADGAEELVLVGDPDQSIYAFRGADESAIREVDQRFGRGAPVPTVALQVSRRAGPVLLAASRRVADRLPGPVEQRRLHSATDEPGTLQVETFRTASEEGSYIAGTLRTAHLDGMPWTRMAVLVRSTSAVLGTLRRALITAGVPVSVRGEDLPLAEQPAVAVLLEVLGCVLDPAAVTEDVAERLLTGPIGGTDVVLLRRLRRALREVTPDGEPVLLAPAVLDRLGASVLPSGVGRPLERVARVLAAGQAVVGDGSPEDVLWAVWEASGLSARWHAASRAGGIPGAAADRDLDAVVQLFEAAARYTDRLPGARTDAFTEHLAAQEIPGDSMVGAAAQPDAVAILTAHASKGLEWDLVCVAHAQEGTWPDLRRRGSLLGSEQLVDILAGRLGGVTLAGPQLAEERRLFYVAATRARRQLLVTAVTADDEQPSRFLDELDPVDGERDRATRLRGTHLPALVAELRTAVCDPTVPELDRDAAASALARLVEARVRGADPDDWWGLAPLSHDGPVADPARPVPVSPSRIDAFSTCELRAVLGDLGATDGDAVSASLGTVIHDVAARAPEGATLDELDAMLDERWRELDFGARWFATNERVRARRVLETLHGWLSRSRSELHLEAVEEGFSAEIGDAVVTGRVDRLERDREGRLVVVDLKTGKTKVKGDDLPHHPQLGAYQLAVRSGAFGPDEESGGAMLVQLAASGRPEQRQAPLQDADDPEWIAERVAHVASRLRGNRFDATVSATCSHCAVRRCCPLYPEGRQVTT